MRKIILAAAILISLAFIQAEKYYVTFIKGSVIVQSSGKAVKVGDALLLTDKLVFKDADARLTCISPGKGRFNISSGQSKATGGELMAVLKTLMVPAASNQRLSTRSMPLYEYDPKTYFRATETRERVLLIKDQAFPVLSSYITDESNYFFIQYKMDDKTVTKKIKHNGTGLIFTDELFTDLVYATTKVKLGYQTNNQGTSHTAVLATFIPVPASKNEVKEQIRLITSQSGLSDQKAINNEIMAHLYENYGKIGAEELLLLIE